MGAALAANDQAAMQDLRDPLPRHLPSRVNGVVLWERPWPRMTRHRHRPLLIVIKEIGKTRDLPSAAIEQWM
ncbi:MAG TPA: hypothetical protein DEO91_14465 [Pseudomonas sp.]|nr:hypothetical protein [Pseudomonas sp.]